MPKKPKESHSRHSLKERKEMARKLLMDADYNSKEIDKIIDKAFYET